MPSVPGILWAKAAHRPKPLAANKCNDDIPIYNGPDIWKQIEEPRASLAETIDRTITELEELCLSPGCPTERGEDPYLDVCRRQKRASPDDTTNAEAKKCEDEDPIVPFR